MGSGLGSRGIGQMASHGLQEHQTANLRASRNALNLQTKGYKNK